MAPCRSELAITRISRPQVRPDEWTLVFGNLMPVGRFESGYLSEAAGVPWTVGVGRWCARVLSKLRRDSAVIA